MRAVFDTSTLQSLHRGGVLEVVPLLFCGGVLVPESVAVQTRQALTDFGRELVPDIDAIAWIGVEPVSSEERDRHRDAPPGSPGRRGPASTTRPLCHGFALDIEEFDAVVLALRFGARVILDDRRGLRCAERLGVPGMTTVEVLDAFASAGLVRDAAEPLSRMEALGYHPTRRNGPLRSTIFRNAPPTG